eukprot:m.199274 g.199274  ORF g.199274 m.199274 type:complete len:588 (+) comp15724_c0_seq2:296-2059(+)
MGNSCCSGGRKKENYYDTRPQQRERDVPIPPTQGHHNGSSGAHPLHLQLMQQQRNQVQQQEAYGKMQGDQREARQKWRNQHLTEQEKAERRIRQQGQRKQTNPGPATPEKSPTHPTKHTPDSPHSPHHTNTSEPRTPPSPKEVTPRKKIINLSESQVPTSPLSPKGKERANFPPELQVQASAFVSPHNLDDLFTNWVKIGQGAASHIYRAVQSNGKPVVLKRFKAQVGKPKDKEDWFDIFKELQILSICDHPNIISYYGSFQEVDKVFAAIGYCAGSCIDLMTALNRGFQESEIACLASQLIQGLEYLHGRRIVHRDMKCANILLAEDGGAIISDFGVSSILNDEDDRCHTFVGSPYWIAPEVITAMEDGSYFYPADIWSFGITLIELALTKPYDLICSFSRSINFFGYRPLFELNSMSALFHIPENPPPTLPQDDNWSISCHDFLQRCLQKEPELRLAATQLVSHPFVSVAIEGNLGKAKIRSLLITVKETMNKPVDVSAIAAQLSKQNKPTSPLSETRRNTMFNKPKPAAATSGAFSIRGSEAPQREKTEEEVQYMRAMRQKSMKNPKRNTKKTNASPGTFDTVV